MICVIVMEKWTGCLFCTDTYKNFFYVMLTISNKRNEITFKDTNNFIVVKYNKVTLIKFLIIFAFSKKYFYSLDSI